MPARRVGQRKDCRSAERSIRRVLAEKRRDGGDRDHLGVRRAAQLVFDFALIPGLLGDDESMGDADQVSVGEFDPRPLRAIVQQDVEPGFL